MISLVSCHRLFHWDSPGTFSCLRLLAQRLEGQRPFVDEVPQSHKREVRLHGEGGGRLIFACRHSHCRRRGIVVQRLDRTEVGLDEDVERSRRCMTLLLNHGVDIDVMTSR